MSRCSEILDADVVASKSVDLDIVVAKSYGKNQGRGGNPASHSALDNVDVCRSSRNGDSEATPAGGVQGTKNQSMTSLEHIFWSPEGDIMKQMEVAVQHVSVKLDELVNVSSSILDTDTYLNGAMDGTKVEDEKLVCTTSYQCGTSYGMHSSMERAVSKQSELIKDLKSVMNYIVVSLVTLEFLALRSMKKTQPYHAMDPTVVPVDDGSEVLHVDLDRRYMNPPDNSLPAMRQEKENCEDDQFGTSSFTVKEKNRTPGNDEENGEMVENQLVPPVPPVQEHCLGAEKDEDDTADTGHNLPPPDGIPVRFTRAQKGKGKF